MNPSFWFGAGGNSRLEVSGEDGHRSFCRRWHDGARCAVLAILVGTTHRTPDSLDRLTHNYELKDDLGGAWTVRPLEPSREPADSTSDAASVRPYRAWILSIVRVFLRLGLQLFLSPTICNSARRSICSVLAEIRPDLQVAETDLTQHSVRRNVLHGGTCDNGICEIYK